MLADFRIVGQFLIGRAMTNGNVSLETGIYIIHHTTENPAVCRGVLQVVRQDVIVYHLVDDGILKESFRHIPTPGDDELKVLIFPPTPKCASALVAQLAKQSACRTQPDWQWGQCSREDQGIEFVELALDIFYGCYHIWEGECIFQCGDAVFLRRSFY